MNRGSTDNRSPVARYSVTTAGRTVPWQLATSATNNGALKFLVRDQVFLTSGSDDAIVQTKEALLRIASCLSERPSLFSLIDKGQHASCYKLQLPEHVHDTMFVVSMNINASLDTCSHFLWEMKYERMKDNIFPSGYTCLAKFNDKEVINHMTLPPHGQEPPKDRVVHERYFAGPKEAVITCLSVESPLFLPQAGVDREVVSLFGFVLQRLGPNKTRIVAVSERNVGGEESALQQEAQFWITHLNDLGEMCHTGVIPEGPLAQQRREQEHSKAAAAKTKGQSCCCFGFLLG